jgi:DNA-binding NarL/FixJ family response regulator
VGALEPFASAFPKLTRREHEVLALIAQQQSNQEVAEALSLSPKPVRNYTSSIFVGLQVADPAGASLKARDAAL